MGPTVYVAVAMALWAAGALIPSPALLVAGVALGVLAALLFGLSRLGRACLQVSVAPPAADVPRGGQADFVLTIRNRSPLPVGVARVSLACRYRDGQTDPLSLLVQATCRGRSAVDARVTVSAPHCGVLEVQVTEVGAADPLGLFCARRALTSTQAHVAVAPRGDRPSAAALPFMDRTRTSPRSEAAPRPGAVPPDVYDVRAYAPGDPLHAVHWKLSARTGSLATRIHCDDDPCDGVLFVDATGAGRLSADDADALLEAAVNVAGGLVRGGAAFTAAWIDGDELRSFSVQTAADVARLGRALASAAPAAGDAPDFEGLAPLLTLRPGPELHLGATLIASFGLASPEDPPEPHEPRKREGGRS